MYRNKTRFTSCQLYLYNEKNVRTMMVKKTIQTLFTNTNNCYSSEIIEH